LNVQLSQLAAEENKRNPQLVAALKTQVEAAQVKANSAYTHFLVTTARSTGTALRDLGQRWYDEDDNALSFSPPAERDARRSAIARHYFALARSLLESADSLRQELLQHLPPGSLMPDDQNEATRIRKILAGNLYPRESIDVRDVGVYLYDLANRIEPE
jgi:hypothetical protein